MTDIDSESLVFYHVAELARRLGGHITIYDLETTTFRGRPNFGIMEVACFMVTPQGPGLAFDSLINPERSIEPKVSELTGLTNRDVMRAETWGKRYASLFARMAKEQWVAGFNNKTFDNPAVIDMSVRYGPKIERFEKTFDVRELHLTLSASKSRKGNLEETAALYGVFPRGHLHRAKADVALTLELLNAIIDVYGLDAVCELILPKAADAYDRLTAQAIARYVKSSKRQSVTLEALSQAFGKDVSTVSFELGKAIDERLVDPEVFAHSDAQAWLEQALLEVNTEVLTAGKLKPLHDALAADAQAAGLLDYVQLRVALLRAGLDWASLKPAGQA